MSIRQATQGVRPQGVTPQGVTPQGVTDVLVVDWSRCVGHGVCAAALGEQVSLDRWGYPQGVSTTGVPVDPELRRAARMAVRTCPAAALRLDKRA